MPLEQQRKKLFLSAVQMKFYQLKMPISTVYGLIIDPHNDQLSVGLTAQLVEHCTGIAEVRVRVPFRSFFHLSIVIFVEKIIKGLANNTLNGTNTILFFLTVARDFQTMT